MIHIPKSEYARRRKALMAQMEPNSIAILPAAAVAIRNRDVEHVYRQDSNFQYLSGFPEPAAVIVLIPGRAHGEYVLFCRERNAERELWDGLRAGQEGAIRDFGADDAFPITDLDDILPGLIEGRSRVYSAMGGNPEFDRNLMDWINAIRSKANLGAQPPNEFVALDHLLHDMRLYKSAAELKVMRHAAQISARAHVRAMQQPGELRGRVRDALTHFDECGIVVLSAQPQLLNLLRDFRWRELFVEQRAAVRRDMRFVVFGHATYEALLAPFRGLTAKAVLYEVDASWLGWPRAEQVAAVDRWLAADMAAGRFVRPRDFHPLPLLGIPGVVPESEDATYYDDTWQFRPGRRALV